MPGEMVDDSWTSSDHGPSVQKRGRSPSPDVQWKKKETRGLESELILFPPVITHFLSKLFVGGAVHPCIADDHTLLYPLYIMENIILA